jgi:hypothetical protein
MEMARAIASKFDSWVVLWIKIDGAATKTLTLPSLRSASQSPAGRGGSPLDQKTPSAG